MGGTFNPDNAQDIFVLLAEAASHQDRRASGKTCTPSHRPPPDEERLKAIVKQVRVKEVKVGFYSTVYIFVAANVI